MPSAALLPALALVAGSAAATASSGAAPWIVWSLPPLVVAAVLAWWARQAAILLALCLAAFAIAGFALAGDARDRALHTSLRARLHQEYGGFTIDGIGVAGRHDPVLLRAVLTEDAAPREDYVSLRAEARAIRLRGVWQPVAGGVSLTVTGMPALEQVAHWRAGRTLEAPVAFRRATRYLNEGVPDFERNLALGGTTLFGSIKSGLLVEVVARGSGIDEAAATIRASVRRNVDRWIGGHDPVSGAIVTAILIGDRTGLPDEIRTRLQAAGTYHVIAISGGNIAILAALVVGLLMLGGIRGRPAAVITIGVLLAYAQVVTTEASVWRATLMATLYLAARVLDQRTSPWHALSVAAALMVIVRPLDVRDPGFILSFGATLALLEGARRGSAILPRRRVLAWVVASIVASTATEIALLPVAAHMFSRVTSAGLLLNLLAVPLMTVIQTAGMTVAILQPLDAVAAAAGWLAHISAALLVNSARLVDVAPWLAARVPTPHPAVIVIYYASLAAVMAARRRRRALAGLALLGAAAVIAGFDVARLRPAASPSGVLRLTAFDVGQAEALLLQGPRGGALLVDAGGSPFGSGSFDIGGRVLAPAVWTRGPRSLAALLITHGHPDHIGGALSVLRDLAPKRLWHGVDVPQDIPMRELVDAAITRGIAVEQRLAGERWDFGGAHVRVLHPPAPDWERPQVRNDDSIVLEVVYGRVALLLTGDAGAEIERAIIPQLTPSPVRVLKVAHHGSRSSSSRELLERWRPRIAVISSGRGNTFGHPAPEVLRRLEAIGATVLRTDLHGQITIETDGREVAVRTFVATENAGR